MKTSRSLLAVAAFAASSLAALAPVSAQDAPSAGTAAPSLDFGNFTSETLTTKAWHALEAKDFASVQGYTGKCIQMYKAKALEMQKALTAPPATDNKEKVFANWALNDVGTCYFILGKALEQQGKTKEAVEAYKFVAANLTYAKCYDTKGWFWSPADGAAERVKALEFDSLK